VIAFRAAWVAPSLGWNDGSNICRDSMPDSFLRIPLGIPIRRNAGASRLSISLDEIRWGASTWAMPATLTLVYCTEYLLVGWNRAPIAGAMPNPLRMRD